MLHESRPAISPSESMGISRRRLLQAAVLLTLSAAHRSTSADAAVSSDVPSSQAELITGGELVSESVLADLYVTAYETRQPLFEKDPTMLRSTVYHAMKFYGLDDAVAQDRSNRISISSWDTSSCPKHTLGCVHDQANDANIELTQDLFPNFVVDNDGWARVLEVTSHESYHAGVLNMQEIQMTEDYGVLGQMHINGVKFGFAAAEESDDIIADIIHKQYTGLHIILPEEFFAEFAQQRFIKHLQNALPDSLRECAVFAPRFGYNFARKPVLAMINDFGRKSQTNIWQGELSPEAIDKLHREGDRYELYRRIGQAMIDRNPSGSTIQHDKPNIAALGAVTFADFADMSISDRSIMRRLQTKKVTPVLIMDAARQIQNITNKTKAA